MKKSAVIFLSLLAGAAAGAFGAGKIIGKSAERHREASDKYLSLFLMMNQWVKMKQAGKDPASCLERKGYREIAVYGMGHAGKTLARELAGSAVRIRYGIDRNADIDYEGFGIVTPEDALEPVDAVVVTAVSCFDEIQEMLGGKMDCPVVSLEDILYEM